MRTKSSDRLAGGGQLPPASSVPPAGPDTEEDQDSGDVAPGVDEDALDDDDLDTDRVTSL